MLSSIQTSADCANTTHFKGTDNNASVKSSLLESNTCSSSELNTTTSSSKQQSFHKSSSAPMLAENTTNITATNPGTTNYKHKIIKMIM